jgi:hypothetical protein
MNLLITIIAVLLVSDASFTLLNLTKVESILKQHFPNINIKKLAAIEGLVGLVILMLKISTGTLS